MDYLEIKTRRKQSKARGRFAITAFVFLSIFRTVWPIAIGLSWYLADHAQPFVV